MCSPSSAAVAASREYFECHWQPSRHLLIAYLVCQMLAFGTLLILDIALWALLLGMVLCLVHGGWVLPRQVLLSHREAFTRLRHGPAGWELWNSRRGWQPVQLRPDSLALPTAVVLRFRLPGQHWIRGLCLPADTLSADQHRRLRVRLKFSRKSWVEAE